MAMPHAGASFENLGEQTEAKRLLLRQRLDSSRARADDSLLQVDAFPVRETYVPLRIFNERDNNWMKIGANYGIIYSKHGSDPAGLLKLRYAGKTLNFFRPGDRLIGAFPDMDVAASGEFQFHDGTVVNRLGPTANDGVYGLRDARIIVLNTPDASYEENPAADTSHESIIIAHGAFTDEGGGSWVSGVAGARRGVQRLRIIIKSDITSATLLVGVDTTNLISNDAIVNGGTASGWDVINTVTLPSRVAFAGVTTSNSYAFTMEVSGWCSFQFKITNITGGAVANTKISVWAIE